MQVYREQDSLTAEAFPIPYRGLSTSFYSNSRQIIIPFLGAGASLPSTQPQDSATVPSFAPDRSLMDRICGEELGLTDPAARIVVELAISVAIRMQSATPGPLPPNMMYERLKISMFPPSASDLAEAFAEESSYNHFEWAFRKIHDLDLAGAWDSAKLLRVLRSLSDLIGLGNPTPSLLEVASYYENTFKRDKLRNFLSGIFNERKSEPASTHRNIAEAAALYIEANKNNDEAEDYLIITTNYDGLIEIALDRASVPYAVMTVPRDDWKVDVRLSNTVQSYLQYSNEKYARFRERIPRVPPRDFSDLGKRSRPLAILYKIHGDLHPPDLTPRLDSIIISDDDYVRYINQDARLGMVPAMVTNIMAKKDLLILGYRFADWNIRSLYRSIAEKRVAGVQGDWAVLKAIGRYERGFFSTQGINIIETSLDRFWAGICDNRSPDK